MTDGDTEGVVEQSRLHHLDRCRRHRCFARELQNLEFFCLPPNHPDGPAHGLRLTVPDNESSHLIRFFTARPLLVEIATGASVITLTCICRDPRLHEDLFDHLCAVFNSQRF